MKASLSFSASFPFLFAVLNDTRPRAFSPSEEMLRQQQLQQQQQQQQQQHADPPVSVHIEVDIDPPPRGPSDPSDEELRRLGLPTHHVHFSTDDDEEQVLQDNTVEKKKNEEEEILRPDDLSIVTYQPKSRSSSSSPSSPGQQQSFDYPMDDPNAYQVREIERNYCWTDIFNVFFFSNPSPETATPTG